MVRNDMMILVGPREKFKTEAEATQTTTTSHVLVLACASTRKSPGYVIS